MRKQKMSRGHVRTLKYAPDLKKGKDCLRKCALYAMPLMALLKRSGSHPILTAHYWDCARWRARVATAPTERLYTQGKASSVSCFLFLKDPNLVPAFFLCLIERPVCFDNQFRLGFISSGNS